MLRFACIAVLALVGSISIPETPQAEAGPLKAIARFVAGAARKVGRVASAPLRVGSRISGRANAGCN